VSRAPDQAGPAPLVARVLDSDVVLSLKRSPGTILAIAVLAVLVGGSLLAPMVAAHHPFDGAHLNLMDALTPPAWQEAGDRRFLLGTDNQGRDLLFAILYGMRLSLLIGFLSILLAMAMGISIGLLAGYAGGVVDHFLMRLADVQLSFPAILIALVVDGLARAFISAQRHDELAVAVLVLAIGLSKWALFARTVRSSALVERRKEYVEAARLVGRRPFAIAVSHVLPNTLGPILVIATINLALAIITEATLSFLGVGLPPATPSLGTLIRVGNEYLFSGQWWIAICPGVALILLVVSVNVVGDWLRDVLNPKLR
jgi:peptide/nickel transport system permease protein